MKNNNSIMTQYPTNDGQIQLADFFRMKAKVRQKRAQTVVESLCPESINGAIGVPEQTRIGRVVDIGFNNSRVGRDTLGIAFVVAGAEAN